MLPHAWTGAAPEARSNAAARQHAALVAASAACAAQAAHLRASAEASGTPLIGEDSLLTAPGPYSSSDDDVNTRAGRKPPPTDRRRGGCRRCLLGCCGACCCILSILCALLIAALIPVRTGLDANYSSNLFAFQINGAQFTPLNYYVPLAQFMYAALAPNWRYQYGQWFQGFTKGNPMIGYGPGGNTTAYYDHAEVTRLLKGFGASIANGTRKRESELALATFNNLMWPDAGKFALGLPQPDHAVVRPFLARMFDLGQGQPGGWTMETLRDEFRLILAGVRSFESSWSSKTFLTVAVIKVLHKVALGMRISDPVALELEALQQRLLLPAALPERLAGSFLIWNQAGKLPLERMRFFIRKYKSAIRMRWPEETWSDRRLTLLASVFLDAILTAGGRSVPLALDIVLGYILTKNKPSSLMGQNFTQESTIRSLLMEAMRYHPPVTTVPSWVTRDGGISWRHEQLSLDRALADPKVFPDPDAFILDRPGYGTGESGDSSLAWGEAALVDDDLAHPDSHACPGKQLSIAMVIAFVQEFQARGPWVVVNNDITMNYYGTGGFEVARP
eukprot:TRINITY_DN14593_c0_g1_i1.p1 TRINITY_DN14593_c0_g1~~TRINITY_DN14593_c0_g1_i1.p1  ORF type:complete len:562 (+),score=96.78 TRINITY_DN14593_c0_g1_i1:84-1769(+)